MCFSIPSHTRTITLSQLRTERAIPYNPRVIRLDPFHGDIVKSVDLTVVEYLHNSRMLNPSHDDRFVDKPLDELALSNSRWITFGAWNLKLPIVRLKTVPIPPLPTSCLISNGHLDVGRKRPGGRSMTDSFDVIFEITDRIVAHGDSSKRCADSITGA